MLFMCQNCHHIIIFTHYLTVSLSDITESNRLRHSPCAGTCRRRCGASLATCRPSCTRWWVASAPVSGRACGGSPGWRTEPPSPGTSGRRWTNTRPQVSAEWPLCDDVGLTPGSASGCLTICWHCLVCQLPHFLRSRCFHVSLSYKAALCYCCFALLLSFPRSLAVSSSTPIPTASASPSCFFGHVILVPQSTAVSLCVLPRSIAILLSLSHCLLPLRIVAFCAV